MLLLAAAVMAAGCTEATRAHRFGGTMTVDLEPQQKLVNASWKSSRSDGTNLWLLTRERAPEEAPTTYNYSERSQFGVFQGVVRIVEH